MFRRPRMISEMRFGGTSIWRASAAALTPISCSSSFVEYGEYSYTSKQGVKSALAVTSGVAGVLDNMQT